MNQNKLSATQFRILVTIGKNALNYAQAIIKLYPRIFGKIFILQAIDYSEKISMAMDNVTLEFLSHPLPNMKTFSVSSSLLKYFSSLDQSCYFHFVITGGTSSCLAYPEPGIKFDQYRETMQKLLLQGTNIFEFNEIRSIIDCMKGGKLSIALDNHFVDTSIISDVLTNDPRYVGSGPTVPGLSLSHTSKNRLDAISKEIGYHENLATLLENFTNCSNYSNINHDWNIIASNIDLCNFLLNSFKLRIKDHQIKIIDTQLDEDAIRFAKIIFDHYNNIRSNSIHIWSGELTAQINIKNFNDAEGGRLSLFSLYAAELFSGIIDMTLISFATDGKDGSSPVSGYLVSGETLAILRKSPNYSNAIIKGCIGRLFANSKFGIETRNTNINFADLIILIKN